MKDKMKLGKGGIVLYNVDEGQTEAREGWECPS